MSDNVNDFNVSEDLIDRTQPHHQLYADAASRTNESERAQADTAHRHRPSIESDQTAKPA